MYKLLIFLFRLQVSSYEIKFLKKFEYLENNEFKFGIDFNFEINQPRFVWYIQPESRTGKGCNECGKCGKVGKCIKGNNFKVERNFENPIKHADYNNILYIERGHLVPGTDFGCITYVISNAIPQYSKFNQGIWLKSEMYIRCNYVGKLVIKTCSNIEGEYINTRTGKRLFVPKYCYFIVLDNYEIYENKIIGDIIDNYRLENSKSLSCKDFKSCSIRDLPDYLTENIDYKLIIFIISCVLIGLVFIVIFSITIYNKICKCKYEIWENEYFTNDETEV